jgi:hypothetical protein
MTWTVYGTRLAGADAMRDGLSLTAVLHRPAFPPY